jgi:hypothetical protein
MIKKQKCKIRNKFISGDSSTEISVSDEINSFNLSPIAVKTVTLSKKILDNKAGHLINGRKLI